MRTTGIRRAAMLGAGLLVATAAVAQDATTIDLGEPFGELRLVDEIDCGQAPAAEAFVESAPGVSRIETVFGRSCRVMPNDGQASKYFGYLLGKGKGLQAGKAYVLAVEFPEDVSRAMFIVNRGCDTNRGLYTGQAIGDVLHTWVNSNPESLHLPLSGGYSTWKAMFHLHDRFRPVGEGEKGAPRPMTPADGFWVIIAQTGEKLEPVSAGAAVARIRLLEVADPASLDVKLRLPPAGLPQRHLFYREEASDSAVSGEPAQRGVADATAFFEYQARTMKFLGMNTFSKDLLEWGHNQGWDSVAYGGTEWVNASSTPKRWENMLTMLARYDLNVLPYYEYSGLVGSKSVGSERRARPLTETDGKGHYTHILWSEKANADVTDPEMLDVTCKMLDATILQFKDKVDFVGAWLRPRPGAMPISFSDDALAQFAAEANDDQAVTREQLQKDEALLHRYYGWWFAQRKEFLAALRDYLRQGGLADAMILMTASVSEPGPSLPGVRQVVTDDMALWTAKLSDPMHEGKIQPVAYEKVVGEDLHHQALLAQPGTWGQWEWHHGCPQPDPQNYRDTDGVLFSCTFNRAYTVASPKAFDTFRGRDGLAIVRHFAMNEEVIENKALGQFLSDMEPAGPYCMLGEARAMANGDPRYLGYLTTITFTRGFPQYVREFNAAFLALPALPSRVLEGAANDPEVVVRAIDAGEHGTYFAAVNTGLSGKQVAVRLPVAGSLTNAATGEPVGGEDGTVRLSMYPCQLISLHAGR